MQVLLLKYPQTTPTTILLNFWCLSNMSNMQSHMQPEWSSICFQLSRYGQFSGCFSVLCSEFTTAALYFPFIRSWNHSHWPTNLDHTTSSLQVSSFTSSNILNYIATSETTSLVMGTLRCFWSVFCSTQVQWFLQMVWIGAYYKKFSSWEFYGWLEELERRIN